MGLVPRRYKPQFSLLAVLKKNWNILLLIA